MEFLSQSWLRHKEFNTKRLKMMVVKSAVLALLCICQLSEFSLANKTLDIQHRKLDFPEQELIFSYESYLNGNDVYAACKMVDKNDQRMCKVVREKTPNSRDIQSCDVSLHLNNRTEKSNKKNDKIAIVPLGKDHAIFYMVEEGKIASVIFKIINFNDCKINEIEIRIMNPGNNPKQAVTIVPYSDSFDVYYRDSTRCGDKNLCKMIVDIEGKITKGPDASIDINLYQSFPPYILPISTQSRDKGIFYMKHVDGSLSEYDFIVQKSNGVEKSLGKHQVYSSAIKSTVHDFIGVCFTNDPVNSTVQCMQYDADGNLKFKVEQINANDSVSILYVYNLPKGGFLLFTSKCAEKGNCDLDTVNFGIIKIDSVGKKVGSFNIGKLTFESGIKAINLIPSFYINKEHKYCALIAQYKSTDSGHRNIGYISSSTSCITDADFTN